MHRHLAHLAHVAHLAHLTLLVALLALLALVVLAACATAPPPPVPSPARPPAPPAPAPAPEIADDEPPETFKDALARYASTCPVPFFTLAQPETVRVGDLTFTLSGSVLTLQRSGPWQGPLKIGVVGAIKDADAATRANMKRAAAVFAKRGVHVVVANGDLVGDDTAALVPVVQMIGEELALPVLAHSGNYEWTSAFTAAFATGPTNVFDMNIVRDVDFGGVHVVSLPGYFNRRFLQPGACHYDDDDVAELARHTQALAAKGDVVVLTSHGPPFGKSAQALDVTHEGTNVGDPRINALLGDGNVRFGVFSHILESGGRAVTDVDGTAAVRLPMKATASRLYANAGAATSFGWAMLGGKTSRGIALVLTIDTSTAEGTANVELIDISDPVLTPPRQ